MLQKMMDKINCGKVALGFAISYSSPYSLECVGSDWDWIWMDAQHGHHDYKSLLHCVQICDLIGVTSLIRPPGHSADVIGPILDTGVDSVMIPMVNSVDEARQLVQTCFFPPLGERSYGSRRIMDRKGLSYTIDANEKLLLVAQIETPRAVEAAEEIAAVEGIGALFFGSEDVKIRLGVPNTTHVLDSPETTAAMEKVASAARNAGKAAGCIGFDPPNFKRAVEMGYNFQRNTSDATLLEAGSQALIRKLREELA